MTSIVVEVAGGLTCNSTLSASRLGRHLFSPQEVAEYGARCLDGSPGGFYYNLCGTGSGQNKLIIWLQGGGYCMANSTKPDIEDCSRRVGTAQGSSDYWGASVSTPSAALWSRTQAGNPDFYNWNVVQILYCSGDLFAGRANTTRGGLYQAGHNILAGMLATLKKDGILDRMTDIILGGGSAGGFGSHINIDYLRRYVSLSTRVSVIPVSGWFVAIDVYPGSSVTPIAEVGRIMYEASSSYVNQDCVAAIAPLPPYMCLLANTSYPYWGVPSFIAENLYDTNQIFGQDGTPLTPDRKLIPATCPYIHNFGGIIAQSFTSVANRSGLFVPSCLDHGVDYVNVRIVGPNGNVNFQQMVGDWYYSRPNAGFPTYRALDPCYYSTSGAVQCNPTCVGGADAAPCNTVTSTTSTTSTSATSAAALTTSGMTSISSATSSSSSLSSLSSSSTGLSPTTTTSMALSLTLGGNVMLVILAIPFLLFI
eukprot:TRINITY_DN3148_c0_g1_i4.p1 TRINITY_DN3148_c0_g1~~TRINITY_DN3148_c0_g1_i4.p1  ORF type:complete len:497 (+),score=82.91 TRINITY_DN3148_c0_g1_i4:56-1492(+)